MTTYEQALAAAAVNTCHADTQTVVDFAFENFPSVIDDFGNVVDASFSLRIKFFLCDSWGYSWGGALVIY